MNPLLSILIIGTAKLKTLPPHMDLHAPQVGIQVTKVLDRLGVVVSKDKTFTSRLVPTTYDDWQLFDCIF